MSFLDSRAPVLALGTLPRVDLLPPSETRRRDMIARARTWAYIGFGALVVAVVTVGGALAFSLTAELRLSGERARTQQILIAIAELSEVGTAISTRDELEALRQDAMAGDLAWVPVLDLMTEHVPPGVVVTEYVLDAGPVPVEGADPTQATGVSGTVTFTSSVAVDFVAATRDLRAVESVRTAELEQLSATEGEYAYTVRIELDQTVYTADHSPEAE